MEIRKEIKEDFLDTENVVREAFWNKYRPGCFEHYIVHLLRREDCFVPELSFVLEDNKTIIGAIFYSKGTLKKENGSVVPALTFGPVAIDPKEQKKGYGKFLINHTLRLASHMGYPFILITGDPNYYKKFGFVPASKYKIFYEGADKNQESPFFMIKVFSEKAMENFNGTYADPKCFMVDEEKVDHYDNIFSPKKKEKRPGQIF